MNFVNYFASLGGFEAILNCLRKGNEEGSNKIPLEIVGCLLAPFRNCNNILEKEFTKTFVAEMNELVYERLRGLTDSDLRFTKFELFNKVLDQLLDFLTLSYSKEAAAEIVETHYLIFASNCLKCPLLEKRIIALKLFG